MYKFQACNEIFIGLDGWLAPNGRFYPCKSDEHDESADYLLEKVEIIRIPVNSTFTYISEFESWKKLNPREKLEKVGFVLVRGTVLYTEEALNFSVHQLESLKKSGIPIISAFDGSTIFEPFEVLEYLNMVSKGLQASEMLNTIRSKLEDGSYSPWWDGVRMGTKSSIDRFLRDPFKTIIRTDEVYGDDYMDLPQEIFNILTPDFLDEVSIVQWRDDSRHRVCRLGSGRLIWVTWKMYIHDGLSGGMYGDYNNYISVAVVDEARQKKVIYDALDSPRGSSKCPPMIKIFGGGSYFSEFFADYH